MSIVGINFPFVGIGGYNKALGLNHFDLLIDWGWFYFITKPMFLVMDFFFRLLGKFGLAILMVTVLVKIVFFPLANKSYASMAKMKAVQPQMMALRERYADDKAQAAARVDGAVQAGKDQSAGWLPADCNPDPGVLLSVQGLVRHDRDAACAVLRLDPRSFGAGSDQHVQLFGLIPVDPTVLPLIGPFLHLGVWPIIMGITMWVQIKLNPAPPDPTQAMIFNWMPLIFTFMLANFPAGLVIYWAWNNLLSVVQQSVIMRKHGAKIELFDNIKTMFVKKTPQQ